MPDARKLLRTTDPAPVRPLTGTRIERGSNARAQRGASRMKLAVSNGGGVNSVSMLIGMAERSIVPDLIEYADPGRWLDDPAEKRETYEYMDNWLAPFLARVGFPPVTVVRHPTDTLYTSCIRNGTLPSKAYGFPGCSVKFKHQLMEAHEHKLFGDGYVIAKAIGYHAEETRRSDIEAKDTKHGHCEYRYFLREWGWKQADCIAAIQRAGMPIPMKSACYFCPSSKKHEIIWLAEKHPDLFAKAVALEENAKAYHAERGDVTKGLGRTFSWKELVQLSPAAAEKLREPESVPCMCYDGGDEED
jgi:hypothetical protein